MREQRGDLLLQLGDKGWLFESRDSVRTFEQLDFEQGEHAHRVDISTGLAARELSDYQDVHRALVTVKHCMRGELGDWFAKLDDG